jgi:hypothetical protein
MSHPNDGVSQLNKLLQQDASQVLTWVKDILTGELPTPEKFNWLGLAEAAAFKASCEKRKEDSLQWAEVAISVYEYLMKNADLAGRHSFVCSLMHLRAYMIIRYGAVSQDRVLDIKQVIDLFFCDMNMSYTEAATKAAVWKSLGPRSIRVKPNKAQELLPEQTTSDATILQPNSPGMVESQSLSKESILKLRRIKNRLSALKSLSDAGKLPLNPELKSWLALRDKLP